MGAAAGAAIGGAAGLVDGIFNTINQGAQRDWGSAEAQKQRDWEERMSNTAMQRQAADIQAAGLSKSAMYGGGSAAGATTPQGASGGNTAMPANAFNMAQGAMSAMGSLSAANLSVAKANELNSAKLAKATFGRK